MTVVVCRWNLKLSRTIFRNFVTSFKFFAEAGVVRLCFYCCKLSKSHVAFSVDQLSEESIWATNAPVPAYLPPAEKSSATEAANTAVMEELASTDKKRKLGSYHHYSDEVRARMGRHAAEHGNKSAVSKFTKELEHSVNESTIRNCKRLYLGRLKDLKSPDLVTTLPHAAGGRSLLLGDLDGEVAEYVKALRQAGGCVSTRIIIAGTKGIVAHRKKKRTT